MEGLPAGVQMGGMGMGGDDAESTHNAEELDDETYDERLAEYELLLVLFRTRNMQSQQLEKEIELAATELNNEDGAMHVGLVDLDSPTAKKAAKKAGVTEGPIIRTYRRGKPLSLGPNEGDARSLVNYMRYLASPVTQVLPNASAINEWLREAYSTVVLGIFADTTRPSHNTWIQQAEKLRPPFRFAETSIDAAQEAKLFSGPAGMELDPTKNVYAVVLPSKWLAKDEAPYHLSSDFKNMSAFVPDHALPRIGPLSSFAHRKYRDTKRALVSLYFDQQKLGKMFKYIVNRLHKLLTAEPDLTSHFGFTIMGLKEFGPNLQLEFGVPGVDFAVTMANLTTMALYGTDVLTNMSADAFTAMPLAAVLRRIADGEEPPYVKSEPVPEAAPAPGKVEAIVAANFDARANDEAVDVLLGLHSTEEVKALADVAAAFSRIPSVRVAQMNATLNAYNYTRFRLTEKANVFFLPASAGGKAEPIRHDGKGEARATDLVSLVLKQMRSDADADSVTAVKKELKKARKMEEENNPYAGLGGEKKKKKKKKKGKGKKDEL